MGSLSGECPDNLLLLLILTHTQTFQVAFSKCYNIVEQNEMRQLPVIITLLAHETFLVSTKLHHLSRLQESFLMHCSFKSGFMLYPKSLSVCHHRAWHTELTGNDAVMNTHCRSFWSHSEQTWKFSWTTSVLSGWAATPPQNHSLSTSAGHLLPQCAKFEELHHHSIVTLWYDGIWYLKNYLCFSMLCSVLVCLNDTPYVSPVLSFVHIGGFRSLMINILCTWLSFGSICFQQFVEGTMFPMFEVAPDTQRHVVLWCRRFCSLSFSFEFLEWNS